MKTTGEKPDGRECARQVTGENNRLLIVIPCLNEINHIGGLLAQLVAVQARMGGRIVVVDGGSSDGTLAVVQDVVEHNDAVTLLHNPDKIQSAAVNLAVAEFGDGASHLVRIDAHSAYPDDYFQTLLTEAREMQADSVVVSMAAAGEMLVQRINAAAQNSTVGNGGSKHRLKSQGQFVDHGHHALMRIAAFREVGGYDPGFAHNEDAELDYRLRKAGYKIWLTAKTGVTYFPRNSFTALARQYYNFGRGRAQNILKHRIVPRLRQAKVMLVLPFLMLALLSPLHWVFAFPALFWGAYCILSGLKMAWQGGDIRLALSGFAAMLMHFSWSLGFWRNILFVGATMRRGQPV